MAPRLPRLLRGTARRYVVLAATAGVCAALLGGALVAPQLGFGDWPSDRVAPAEPGAIETPVVGERPEEPFSAAGTAGSRRTSTARGDAARPGERRPGTAAAPERRAADPERLTGVVASRRQPGRGGSPSGPGSTQAPFDSRTPVIRVDADEGGDLRDAPQPTATPEGSATVPPGTGPPADAAPAP